VGPVWNGGKNNEEEKLRNCYKNSLIQADLHRAFPNISTGIFKYPKPWMRFKHNHDYYSFISYQNL